MKLLNSLLVLTMSLSLFAQVQLGADIDGEAAYDESGWSVSLSNDGTIVAIAAPFNSGNGLEAGHVRVYGYSNGSWSQLGADIDGEAAGDYSGASVSLSDDGTIVAIGAPFNSGSDTGSGHVRVYEYASGAWSQLGADIDGEAAGDKSGISVSLSDDGTIMAIGAFNNSNGNGTDAGHVRVYQYASGSWSQLGSDIDGEGAVDYSGNSVSLSDDGTIVAIGAPNNSGSGISSGHVRVYGYSNGSWSQLGADIDAEAADDLSGQSVSLSDDGTIVAIGAYGNDGNGSWSGHVRVYGYSNGSWSQIGADIDGEAAGDRSGYSVSLSDDGTIVAIGAAYNGGNGSYAGHVRVYQYASGAWSQLGADIDGGAVNDYSGFSVSLSDDGITVAIGAPHNGGSANTGQVRVYERASGVGIEETSSLNLTSLKPNPNNGHFRIQVAQEQVGSTYRIVDFLGRIIETGTITKPSQDFDLSNNSKGLYRVQVSNEKASKTLNVVIQ